MNGTYIVEKEFDYTDYANQTYHMYKGTMLSYEVYTNPNLLGVNNSLAIHLIHDKSIIRGPYIHMNDYVREIIGDDIDNSKRQNNVLSTEEPYIIQTYRAGSTIAMNRFLEDEIDGKDFVDIKVMEHETYLIIYKKRWTR